MLVELHKELHGVVVEKFLANVAAVLLDLRTHAKSEACCVPQPPDFTIFGYGLDDDAWKGGEQASLVASLLNDLVEGQEGPMDA